ncbi:S-layer homology domain-containing protein [Sporobacter termitidis DSM 10068]|uniref:S-layer homology domain-containing protein n=1 Tax=Sporobacter termitidis DSM 10068 TaxID=1123282 RepID=A0A1M5ZBD8_9FIRM|nr:S-layer homology domain-containing protein [Sporobacter termitidis]SHI21537.1 S-layer homology domain-containing protein [Sporobacter termitidis DSM 10068]
MKLLKNVTACLIAAVLLIGLVPPAAAADNDSVLTSLGHSLTNTVNISGATRSITLTVPYTSTDTSVNLSNGLGITYDTTIYKSVVASGGEARVGGSAVQVVVTYNYTTEDDTTPKHKTTYTVSIVKAAKVTPAFSGVKTVSDVSTSVSLDSFRAYYTQNNGDPLGAISISGSNPLFGTLEVDGQPYKFGTRISGSSTISFRATSTGTVSYDVKAYESTDTGGARPIGNVVLTFVNSAAPVITSTISSDVTGGAILTFTEAYFTSHCNLNGGVLTSIMIEPTDTANGTWFFDGAAFTGMKTIAASQLPLLRFQAAASGDGIRSATFKWGVTTNGWPLVQSTGTINITSPSLTLTPFTSGVPVPRGGTGNVSLSDFKYTPASVPLTYIKITAIPTAADATLTLATALPKNDTYGYPAIAANAALSTNAVIPAAYVSSLRLVTKAASKAAAVSFSWTATADQKVATAAWAAAPVTYTMNFASDSVVSCATDMNIPVALPASSVSAQFASLTKGLVLSYVTFTLPDKNTGTLYLNYDLTAKTGTAVSASTKYYLNKNPNLANITFVPAADFIGTAPIKYSAYTDSGAFITGTISVSVTNSAGGTFSLQTDKNSFLPLDASAFQSSFLAATGKDLTYVTFSLPSSTYGTLYYNYTAPGRYSSLAASGSAYYTHSAPYLSMVTFVPAHDVTGYVPIYFTGYTSTGAAYSGKLIVSVLDSPGGIVNYSLNENGYIALSGRDFSTEFLHVTGTPLSYITFTLPAAASGTLYEQYAPDKQTGTKAAAATKYTDGSTPDLSSLTFVPAKDFVGTVTVLYKAYNTSGTVFNGKLKFFVAESSQLISYDALSGQPVTMNAGDFMGAFGLLSGGKTLSYVTFELPSATYGRLYYNYVSPSSYDSAVTADKKFYMIGAPYISGVTFVPASGYNGTFTMSYTGYSTTGASYLGKIRITVSGSASGTVSYATNALTPVTFSAADFARAYNAYNPGYQGGALTYVTFTLPYQSYGTLYYSYNPSYTSNTAVTASTAYYANSYPGISNIAFVPNSSFAGVVTINYTAYGTTGVMSGTVSITVKSSSIDVVTYATAPNTPIPLNGEDFNATFLDRTGSTLNYIVFTLPPADQGQLLLGYTSPDSYTAAVSGSSNYYRSTSPRLSDISFVPKTGFIGTVTIAYTGYTVAGSAFTGKLVINVGNSTPFPDMKTGYDWAVPAVSYLYLNGIIQGAPDGNYHPTDAMTRADFVLMVTRAFDLDSSSYNNFPDVPLGTYYYDAIAAAKSYGIVSGGSGGQFYPTAAISRQDAVVILARTLDAMGISVPQGTISDLSAFSDTDQISDYAVSSMASLVKAGALTGSGGKLSPQAMITRAEMATILYKVLVM